MNVLAIGAHPDDLEIYCFGSLVAWQKMGAEISLAIATDGAAGGKGADGDLPEIRRAETTTALAPISASPNFLNLPDGELIPDRHLIDALRGLIAKVTPDLIVTHAPNDYHADHRALSASVLHAAGFSAPVLYMDTLGGTGFSPTHYIDITEHASAKTTAIRSHISQDPERFVVKADLQSAFRAGQCNASLDGRAEAFRFEPRFPFADIRSLLPPAPPVLPVRARNSVEEPK
jgi:LmbE family N-acetylglucosaminyl deacetylase